MSENQDEKQAFLEGGRLRLRALEPEDARAVWEIESDSTQWMQNGMMAPFSLRNIKEYALEYEPDPFRAGQVRLIAELEDKTGDWFKDVVGLVDLYDISASNRTAWVGIYVRPEFRKEGFASEMLQTMHKYASELLNLRQLGAKIVAGNEASRRLFEESGYVLSGCLKDWMICRREPKDLYIYQIEL